MPVDHAFERLLSEFGQSLGIAGLEPSAEGLCQLVFDGCHVVQIVHMGARGQVLLSCFLGDGQVDAAQAGLMARANFLQAGCGAVVCQAPDGRPCMQVALPLSGCGAASLGVALEALLEQADRWRERLAREAATSALSRGGPASFLQAV